MRQIVHGRAVVQSAYGRKGRFDDAVGIGVADENGIIRGAVVFNGFNGVSANIHITSDGSRNWMTREFIWSFFSYAFEQEKLNVLIGMIGEGNERSLKLAKKLGFVEVARIPNAHKTGAVVVMTITKDQCWFLECGNGKRRRRRTA